MPPSEWSCAGSSGSVSALFGFACLSACRSVCLSTTTAHASNYLIFFPVLSFLQHFQTVGGESFTEC